MKLMRSYLFRILAMLTAVMILTPGFCLNSISEAQEMDCDGTIQAWIYSGYYNPGDCKCIGGQPVCNGSSGKSVSGKKYNPEQDIKMMVVGTIFQSLLTSLFMDNNAKEKEAEAARQKALAMQQALKLQKEKAAVAQAEYDKMMLMYKHLDGSQKVTYKSLSDSSLQFKGLDGDMETLAASAKKPFDTASNSLSDPMLIATGEATPFFGDTMPMNQIEFLVNPENDPSVVDLRSAVEYVAKNIKEESERHIEQQTDDKPEPEKLPAPECRNLPQKLKGYIEQRSKFQKTIDLAQEQINIWQNANRNALLNAAKDGLEVFAGDLLEGFTKRAKAAERLQGIFEKKAAQMARDGVNVAEIRARIERLKILSLAGKSMETAGGIKDWQVFIKDGASGIINRMTSSNLEIEEMLKDPLMQKYFETESPELKALLDISKIAASGKVFGKWVAKKMPVVAGVELAINQLYNGTDWYLSYCRLTEAHKINGQVMKTAVYIQKKIDETYLALEECR
ncbi:MAG: hypothetical protein JXL81_10815 [Deltaproteobacteria bacterium]|nr:hypothetical protein [Deltaproteobacteria bacterium]